MENLLKMVELKEFANLVGEYVESQIKSESDLIPVFKIYLKASEKYRAAYIEDVLKSTEPLINKFAENLISLDEFVKSVCDWELSTYVAGGEIYRYDGILNSTLALLRIATAYDNIFKNKINKKDLKDEIEYFGVDVLGEIDDLFYDENIDFSFVLDFLPPIENWTN